MPFLSKTNGWGGVRVTGEKKFSGNRSWGGRGKGNNGLRKDSRASLIKGGGRGRPSLPDYLKEEDNGNHGLIG